MIQAETRNIGYGLAASVALHLLFFVCMAVWVDSASIKRRTPPATAAEPTPTVSLLFADDIQILPEPEAEKESKPEPEPEPVAPKKPAERYIRTTQNESTEQAPEKADFVSDRNTVATSKKAPSAEGRSDLPTMEGVSFLTNELANRDYRNGETMDDSAPPSPPKPEPSIPQDSASAPSKPQTPASQTEPVLAMRSPDPPSQQPAARKSESSLEEMMRELDQKLSARSASDAPSINLRSEESAKETAMESPPAPQSQPTQSITESSPPPVPRAVPLPTPPATESEQVLNNTPNPKEKAFQPHTRTSAVKGTISNRGSMDSVNAAATPTGRYMRQVTSSIERKWHALRRVHQDFVEPGTLRIRFYVNKEGKTEDITILDNKANAVLTDFSLTAILKADIPPIPKDLLPILERERVEIEYDIVIY